MEEFGMIHTMIDDGDDSTVEIVITRPAMDMISGMPGISESEFVDRFADEIEACAEESAAIQSKDAEGRVLITAYWTHQLRPWLGASLAESEFDAFGRPN